MPTLNAPSTGGTICVRFGFAMPELQNTFGQLTRIERLLDPAHIRKALRNQIGAIAGKEQEGLALPLQFVGDAKCVMSSQVYVDDAYIEAAERNLSVRISYFANKRDNVCTGRSQRRLQVAGEKPLVLNYQDPTSDWGFLHPCLPFAICWFAAPASSYPTCIQSKALK
jgi:hypothetical protein